MNLTPIPDYGTIMSLGDFMEACHDGSFIDYDGHGNYLTEEGMTNIIVYPSDVMNDMVHLSYKRIIWFNK